MKSNKVIRYLNVLKFQSLKHILVYFNVCSLDFIYFYLFKYFIHLFYFPIRENVVLLQAMELSIFRYILQSAFKHNMTLGFKTWQVSGNVVTNEKKMFKTSVWLNSTIWALLQKFLYEGFYFDEHFCFQ